LLGDYLLLLGLACGGGLLTKGPVVLIHLLLPALLGPLWHPPLRQRAWQWLGRLLLALALGAAIALAWALPAAQRGGAEYADAILWHQTVDRMQNSFAHARAWWYYLPVLPGLLLPWTVMPSVWRRLPAPGRDPALRFLATWVAAVLIAVSFVRGKQPHYLLPLLPALALLGARHAGGTHDPVRPSDRLALAAVPGILAVAGAAFLVYTATKTGASWPASGAVWPLLALPVCLWVAKRGELGVVVPRAASAMALVMALLLAGLVRNPAAAGHDLRKPALMAGQLRLSGAQLVALEHYQGQLTFLGRLERPVEVIAKRTMPSWSPAHPGAYVLTFSDALPEGTTAELVASYPYRNHALQLWRLVPAVTAR
jgi:4-amino-4-deoxy-L-arabinose transferase-like glycosyltransferase